ncbi:MAG: hypothetical protein V1798_08630 [Pseudomonadota bacterium]
MTHRLLVPILLIATSSLAAPASSLPEAVPQNVPGAVEKQLKETQQKLLTLDCPLLVQVYDPKDAGKMPMGLCLYTKIEARGIFAQSACVGVFVEPQSLIRSPFYGKNGHWGVEGRCTTESLIKKSKDPEISKTVNPISSLRIKREEGMKLRLLRDDLKVWDALEPLTQPKKK